MTSTYTDLQDYTYYFVPAPWLCVKLLRLLQNYTPPGKYNDLKNFNFVNFVEEAGNRARLLEVLEVTILL